MIVLFNADFNMFGNLFTPKSPSGDLGVRGTSGMNLSHSLIPNHMANDMFYGASPQLFLYAKALRKAMTPAELVLWEYLRLNRLNGVRFKAQHPIGHFITDFYSHTARLVIELDGSIHDPSEQQEYDANRTYILNEFGIRVIRFRNEEVLESIDEVLAKIVEYLP